MDCIAQPLKLTAYQYPVQIPRQYIFDSEYEYRNMLSDTKSQIPSSINKADYARFAEAVAYSKKSLFLSGDVYLGWTEMEDYLNGVLRKILPDSLKGMDIQIYVYPVRSAEYNAFAIPDGTMFFNIGFLADLNNEAGLAVILGHEFSHFLYADSRTLFVNNLKKYNLHNKNKNMELRIEHAHGDKELELRADSIGYVLASKADYNLNYALNNFNQFNKNRFHPIGNSSDMISRAYSDTSASAKNEHQSRAEYLKSFIKTIEKENGTKDFVVDKEMFKKLQSQARLEVLNILLQSHRYSECAEKAFYYHLFEPKNNAYLYYIIESGRRFMYLNERVSKTGFLADRYEAPFKAGEGILHHLHLLVPEIDQRRQILAKDYLDKKHEFGTYEEAFLYFTDLALKRGIKETYLSLALHTPKTDSKRLDLLNTYIEFKDALYPDYAKALLNNQVLNTLSAGDRKVLIMEDFSFLEEHFYGYSYQHINSEKKNPEYRELLEGFLKKHFPDKQLVNYRQLSTNNMKLAVEYQEAMRSAAFIEKAFEAQVKRHSKLREADRKKAELLSYDLFELEPHYWYVFRDNNLHSLEYLRVIAFDDKTSFFNPFAVSPKYVYNSFKKFMLQPVKGSVRFDYKVDFFSYTPVNEEKKASFNREVVSYRMKKGHLENTLYHLMMKRENEIK